MKYLQCGMKYLQYRGMVDRLLLASVLAGVLAGLLLVGCARGNPKPAARQEAPPAGQVARAELVSKPGSPVHGAATFREERGQLRIEIEASGLTPGPHGLHIHVTGACQQPLFTSAGEHFNPTGEPHGGPEAVRHHAGDLGNLVASADGVASTTVVSHELTLGEGPRSVVGRSIVIHARADDFTTQPAGAAGRRVGCGVIKPAP